LSYNSIPSVHAQIEFKNPKAQGRKIIQYHPNKLIDHDKYHKKSNVPPTHLE